MENERPSSDAQSLNRRVPYVRPRAPRRTQEAIDDFTQGEPDASSYTHDSNISVRGSAMGGGSGYRRSRSDISRMQENNRYGQYLEIPKGQRSIFASRELARRRRSALALGIVVLLLVGVTILVWRLLANVGL